MIMYTVKRANVFGLQDLIHYSNEAEALEKARTLAEECNDNTIQFFSVWLNNVEVERFRVPPENKNLSV